nr:TolC family protein [Bacteroidales bacterium]
MKKIIVFSILLLTTFSMMAQEKSTYHQFTLEDCIRYAFANSYERQSMELTGQSLETTYKQSKMQRLPNLSASYGQNISNNENGWSSSGNVGVGTSVTIYQGGQINNTIEQNRLNLERNEVQMERYDNQTVLQILQSFLTILGNQELLSYQFEVMHTSSEQLKQGQARYQAGSILESDFLLLQAQYYSDSNNVVDTRINIENNLLDMKVLLSMDPTDNLDIVT